MISHHTKFSVITQISHLTNSAMNTQTLTLTHLIMIIIFIITFTISTIQCYTPPDSIAIDCGSSSNLNDSENRPWLPDTKNSKFILIETSKSLTYTAEKQPIQKDKVPYFTARVSTTSFTYLFTLSTKNPIFIRLHFYPNTYQSFDRSKALFSIKANEFTLLSNFSPSLNADYLKEETFMREYCIYPRAKLLNLTFSPSPDSFVFVNGIEIISIPENLYYGSDGVTGPTSIDNEAISYQLSNHTGLELSYRLNVGGGLISAMKDTGMFREWNEDDHYVNFPGAQTKNLTIALKYTNNCPQYTAPELVYKTARSMGFSRASNEGYNLTWNLPVDSNFTYWVRLHFCEFNSTIQVISDRKFIVYMNNKTAEEYMDVIGSSGGNGVPVYKDYVASVFGANKRQTLSIALHPRPRRETQYSDAILNGIEVFKLSTIGGSLASPNPDLIRTNQSSVLDQPSKKIKKNKNGLIAGTLIGVILAISVPLGFLIFRRGKGRNKKNMDSYVSVKSESSGVSSSLPAHLCRKFSLMEIRAATKDFDKSFVIGHGGFGDVYKGHIDGVDSAVAIKRLNPGSKQGALEFLTEIEMLSQLRHLHLVPLIGYCNDEREMILVYDYMSRGTLRDHLYKTDNPPLSWTQRLQICIGAAKGLHYLHAGAKHMIIHRDVKTTNILLDDKFVAKVSDFGLSKMNPDNTTNTHISTAVKGSFGYLDPEYYRRQQLTEKSDVYSFGVVLFEVLCARAPLDKSLERQQISLANWARNCYDNGTINRIVDPHLAGRIAPECLKKFVLIAISCLDDEGIQRPSMNDLVWNLEFAMQLQDSAKMGDGKLGDVSIEFEHKNSLISRMDPQVSENQDRHLFSSDGIMTSNNATSFTTSSGSSEDKMSSGAVFSEIMNPVAR